jgi:hypothetical protein
LAAAVTATTRTPYRASAVGARVPTGVEPEQVIAIDLLLAGKVTMDIGVARFQDEDAGYLDWIAEHPAGFVINCAPTPLPDACTTCIPLAPGQA